MAWPDRSPVTFSEVELDGRGVAWLTGANRKVREVVMDHVHGGLSPAEIAERYPDLPLHSVHAALAYYYAHQHEVDAEIAESEAWARGQWEASQADRERLASVLTDRLASG
jgi:uncharacterized protein (DUF433 family)